MSKYVKDIMYIGMIATLSFVTYSQSSQIGELRKDLIKIKRNYADENHEHSLDLSANDISYEVFGLGDYGTVQWQLSDLESKINDLEISKANKIHTHNEWDIYWLFLVQVLFKCFAGSTD